MAARLAWDERYSYARTGHRTIASIAGSDCLENDDCVVKALHSYCSADRCQLDVV